MTAQQPKDNSAIPEPRVAWAIAALLAVVILWVANWMYGVSLNAAERGIFGDTFGAVNALYSGLAFVGVVYAILMQRYEVALAKEDAKETKKILDQQSRHLEMQNKFDRQKSFEDTFFKMQSVFIEVAGTITFIKHSAGHEEFVYKGQHAISEISEHIYGHTVYGAPALERYDEYLKRFADTFSPRLSHYFRSIETLLVYVTVSHDIDKEFYAELIRGQMSDAEQKVLFHHCLMPDNERLKGLVERYHLLTGIKDNDVIFPELRDKFKPSAFEFSSSHIDEALNTGWRGKTFDPPSK